MALKQLTKLWRRTSKANNAYWAFKLRDPLPAGTTVMVFRREEQDDGSCGSVCIAVDDERPPAESADANPFRNGRHRVGGQHSPPVGVSTKDDPAAMAPPLDATQSELEGQDSIPF